METDNNTEVVPSWTEGPSGLTLKVKALLNGQEIIYSVAAAVNENTLGELKQKLSELSGVEENRQRLIYLGKVLTPEESKLSDLGILQGNTLLMVERPKEANPNAPGNTSGQTSASASNPPRRHSDSSTNQSNGQESRANFHSFTSNLPNISRTSHFTLYAVPEQNAETLFIAPQGFSRSTNPFTLSSNSPPLENSLNYMLRSTRNSDIQDQYNRFSSAMRTRVYPGVRRLHGQESWQPTSELIIGTEDQSMEVEPLLSNFDLDSNLAHQGPLDNTSGNTGTARDRNSTTVGSDVQAEVSSNTRTSSTRSSGFNSERNAPYSRGSASANRNDGSGGSVDDLAAMGRGLLDLSDTYLAVSESLRRLGSSWIRNNNNVSLPSMSQPISETNLQDSQFNLSGQNPRSLTPSRDIRDTTPQAEFLSARETRALLRLIPSLNRVSQTILPVLNYSLRNSSQYSPQVSFTQLPSRDTPPATSQLASDNNRNPQPQESAQRSSNLIFEAAQSRSRPVAIILNSRPASLQQPTTTSSRPQASTLPPRQSRVSDEQEDTHQEAPRQQLNSRSPTTTLDPGQAQNQSQTQSQHQNPNSVPALNPINLQNRSSTQSESISGSGSSDIPQSHIFIESISPMSSQAANQLLVSSILPSTISSLINASLRSSLNQLQGSENPSNTSETFTQHFTFDPNRTTNNSSNTNSNINTNAFTTSFADILSSNRRTPRANSTSTDTSNTNATSATTTTTTTTTTTPTDNNLNGATDDRSNSQRRFQTTTNVVFQTFRIPFPSNSHTPEPTSATARDAAMNAQSATGNTNQEPSHSDEQPRPSVTTTTSSTVNPNLNSNPRVFESNSARSSTASLSNMFQNNLSNINHISPAPTSSIRESSNVNSNSYSESEPNPNKKVKKT